MLAAVPGALARASRAWCSTFALQRVPVPCHGSAARFHSFSDGCMIESMPDQLNTPHTIRFAVDRMLGRLARMLRMLGYDAFYSQQVSPEELLGLAGRDGRLILTRGEVERRFPKAARINILSIRSESPPQQLRQIVDELHLDWESGLCTRCTECNTEIVGVEKGGVESEVPPRVFQAYSEFYRCRGCGRVYWRGSHFERIKKNLELILKRGVPGT